MEAGCGGAGAGGCDVASIFSSDVVGCGGGGLVVIGWWLVCFICNARSTSFSSSSWLSRLPLRGA